MSAHAAGCADCARIWALDREAERFLRAGLSRVVAPGGLRASVESLGEEPLPRKGGHFWWPLAPALAATLVLVVFMLFSPLGRLDSAEQLARFAEQRHMATLAEEYALAEVADPSTWFEGRVDFEVRTPSLNDPGLVLAGGRVEQLGGSKSAQLVYRGGDRRYSLFVLPARNVSLNLDKGQQQRYSINQCIVEMWQEDERLYLLVS